MHAYNIYIRLTGTVTYNYFILLSCRKSRKNSTHSRYTSTEHHCMYIDNAVSITIDLIIIIRTVVRIVGMGRMSHICNTKCSRL